MSTAEVVSLLVGLLALAGVFWTAWQNRKSNLEVAETAAEVSEDETAVRRTELALSAMEGSLRRMADENRIIIEQNEAIRAANRKLAQQNAEVSAKADDLALRVDRLETELKNEKARSKASAGYIKRLRDWIAQNVPGIDPPSPPREIADAL